MKFNCVIVAKPALKKLKAFVRAYGKIEVGGPMVGFVSGNNLVVIDLDGPGVNGKCSSFSVTIDGEHSKRFCDLAFADSKGHIDYVGDWHCHPAITIQPSIGDENAMRILAESPGLTPYPVSLIYASVLGRFKIYQWNSSKESLILLAHKVVNKTYVDLLINGI